ncbi:MAG: SIMPL domain-containing protein [Anaerolineae bacterium]|nr:SIMPL domain-containing protein [Anaerolineae bacterium]
MKHHLSSVIGLLAVLLATSASVMPATAQTVVPPARSDARLITVTGEAEVNVVPDEVILTLGVETSNRQLRLAKNANDEIVKKVFAAAQAQGVAAKDIQTDYISIEPRYRDSYEQRDFVGFFVRKTVVITLRDVAKFEDLLSDVLDAGANYVHGIQFRTTELRKYRDQARSLAIQAAREKAVAMAKELGQQVGQPAAIREEQDNWWSGYGAWWGAGYAGAMTQNVIQNAGNAAVLTDGPFAPGQIRVTARVTVSFELGSEQ